ncbi:MAG: alpha-amylase family glycosyl hydrolase [Aristaeellaceae bacterium]
MLRSLCALLLALAMLTGGALGETLPAQPVSGVTYEIFVASFQDSNGDGRGDLQGIIDRLDYIESLGVSRIWLMPIHPSVSYHKYDVMDYCAIDPAYGTLEDFDALTAACRERGIGVMLDLVVNHTSKLHPWFLEACQALRDGTDSPTIHWYNFTQGEGQHPVSGTDWYYEGQFGDHMPDLNLDNPEVRAEIARVMTFWQAHGVTGFRLDAVTSYYTGANDSIRDFLTFLCDTARANDPDCYLVGEVWADEGTILDLYRSGVDSLFNFPASDNNGTFVQAALNAKGAAAARLLADWNGKVKATSPASVDAPFLTNHDQARAAGMLRLKAPFEKTAAMLYLLAPGCPTVYYGEELGMTGSGKDENKRLPMVWSTAEGTVLCNPPADADQKQRLKEGVDVQDSDPDSLLNWYRQLIHLRSLAPELLRGTMTAIDLGNPAVACYRVEDAGSAVLALINTHQSEAVTVSLEGLGSLTLLGSVGMPDSPALPADGSLTLPAISCMLLRAE